jgi:HEPN domain-containing protein
MTSEESRYPADWLRVAERDWRRVDRLLQAGDAELAGFCLQQALEKFFKAFLLFNGWGLHRVHDREVLLNAALAYDSSLKSFCSALTRASNRSFLLRPVSLVRSVVMVNSLRSDSLL